MTRLPMDWRRLIGLERAQSARAPSRSGPRRGLRRPLRVGVAGDGPLRADLERLLPGALEPCGGGLVMAGPDAPADLLFLALPEAAGRPTEALANLRAVSSDPVHIAVPGSDEPELVRSLLAAGCDDVLLPPLSGGALVTVLERQRRILSGRNASGPGGGPDGGPGRILAVLKAGGGVGASFLAGQLAARGARDGTAALVDLDLAGGTCGLDFDIATDLSALDVVGQAGRVADMALADILPQTPSGLRVLPAPWPGNALDTLAPEEASDLMEGLRAAFDLTVVDLATGLSPMDRAVVSEADAVLLVMSPSLAHVARGRVLLDQIAETCAARETPALVVVNRCVRGAGLSQSDVRTGLGRAPDAWLPEDRANVAEAQDRGRLIEDVAAGTRIARAVDALAILASEAAEGVPGRVREVAP